MFKQPFAPLLLACTLILGHSTAQADCAPEVRALSGSVSLLSDDWEALNLIADRAESCQSDTLKVTANPTTEHKALQVPALSVTPAEYSSAIVASNTIVPLLNKGLIRPLDSLVEKHAAELPKRQLISFDGEIKAIAFNVNAQHLFYRADLLEQADLPPPSTYDELLAAAETLRKDHNVQYPVVGTYATGWNLANEFINIYLALSEEPILNESLEPAFVNETGERTLSYMQKMAEYMNPDFLSINSNELQAIWEAGEAALAIGWGSRAEALLDQQGSAPDIARNTRLAAAPSMAKGKPSAAAMWWIGFTIASNISDQDAETAFLVMMDAISPSLLEKNAATSVWLVEGYEPTESAAGTLATVESGAFTYPMFPSMSLLHSALGNNIADFLQGKESALQTLKDTADTYRVMASDQGYLNKPQ